MAQLTKKAIRESFIRLINQMPFNRITVKDIVEDCGISRNTFYYHYQDIYELLREIFELEMAKIVESEEVYDSWQEAFRQAISFAFENKKGIYHIYNSVNRWELESYLYKVNGKLMKDFVAKQAEGMNVNEEDVGLIALFYACALVGLVLQWLDHSMKEDPEAVIARMGVMLDGNIKAMLQKATE